jgi:hypothetical protein
VVVVVVAAAVAAAAVVVVVVVVPIVIYLCETYHYMATLVLLNIPVGTPTWQYIPFLSLPLISATYPLSNSSLCSALAKRPSFSAPASETYSVSHAYQICQLTNGRAGWPAEIWIKEATFPSRASINTHIKQRTHQAKKSLLGRI